MSTLIDALQHIGYWAQSSFWIPLAVWTMGALPVYVLLRGVNRVDHHLRYSTLRALLLALPLSYLLIPLVRVVPWNAFDTSFDYALRLTSTSQPATADSSIAIPPGNATPGLPHVLGILTIAALAVASRRLVYIVHHSRQLSAMRRALKPVSDPAIRIRATALASDLGITRNVTLLEGTEGTVPFTFGHRRPSIVVPRSLLYDQDSLFVVLEHELTHVQRADFRSGWIEHLVASVFAVHPLATLLQQRIADLRELCCDAAVLKRRSVSPGSYAQILLHFGTPTTVPRMSSVPMMVHTTSNLKTRIDAMKNHTFGSPPRRRWMVATAALLMPALMAACSTGSDSGKSVSATQVQSEFGIDASGADLARLQVQMEYLTEELDNLRPRLEAAMNGGENLEMMPEYRRFRLLQELYMQRLGAYETMKMEKEADRRLGIASPGT